MSVVTATPLSLTAELKRQEMEPDGIGGLTPSEAKQVGLDIDTLI